LNYLRRTGLAVLRRLDADERKDVKSERNDGEYDAERQPSRRSPEPTPWPPIIGRLI